MFLHFSHHPLQSACRFKSENRNALYCLLVLTGLLLTAGRPDHVQAQPAEEERDSTALIGPDSTRMYQLGTVTIKDRRVTGAEPYSHDMVHMAEINRSDASTIADIIHEVPAARVQTNSRGEAILYLRNTGERQVSIFLDGALLNVPWDNRIDLSLVPTNATGAMIVEKGTPSVLYGANVMGGAVNIVTRELERDGFLTEFRGGAGENGLLSSSVTHLGRDDKFNYIGSFSYFSRDALPLPSDANLPFSQPDADLRTNTDSRIFSGYLRGEYHVSPDDAFGLSLNLADAEKGIAPEGNKNPETDGPRYWRYPDWRNLNVTGTYDLRFGADALWNLRGALWTTLFSQRIDQYGSVEYDAIEASQQDEDLALGGRMILSRAIGESGTVSVAINDLYSGHDQVDSEFDSAGVETEAPIQEYAQHTFSIGGQYEGRIGTRIDAILGGSLDGMITLESADKPKQDPFLEPGLTVGALYTFDESSSVRISGGRKSRFPSLRELYGEALRRFLVNPDLKPESSWNAEAGYEKRFDEGRLEITGFAQLTSNTIDQRSVDTLGGTKRQRINLEGSRNFGVELGGSLSAFRPFRLNAHAMWSSVRAIIAADDGSDSLTFLSEKPEILATLNAGYDFSFGLTLDVEALYTGTAYTLNDDNEFVELGSSMALNARLAYRWFRPLEGIDLLEFHARVDNVTDTVILSQLGLPGPGREIRGGIKLIL